MNEMKSISLANMKNIKGGVSPLVIGIGISSLITFLIGVIEGMTNPKACDGGD